MRIAQLLVFSLFFQLSPISGVCDIDCYFNGKVLRNHRWHEEALWVEDGKIIAPQEHADHRIDVNGLLIVPGYIDVHINGAFGIDFSTEPKRVAEVAKRLPRQGVTAFLPTVVSMQQENYPSIIEALQPKEMQGATNLGIHLEGPFLNPEKKGAQNGEFLVESFTENLEEFFGSLKGVRMVTLAPELPSALSAISYLHSKNIIVALGHSQATYEETDQATTAGADLVTHLCNGLKPFHHRNPGLIGAVLGNRSLMFTVINDGVHLHPASIRMLRNAHPEGLILITDAMAAMGLPDGLYHLGTLEVEVTNKCAYVRGTNTLAGSTLTMDQAVRNLHTFTGCPIEEAIEAATLHPAKLLGIQDTKGSLNIGMDADFLFIDDSLHVKACFIEGKAQHIL